jgi:hypothetical protein
MSLLHFLGIAKTPHELFNGFFVLLLLPPELVIHSQYLLTVLSLQLEHSGLVVPRNLADELLLPLSFPFKFFPECLGRGLSIFLVLRVVLLYVLGEFMQLLELSLLVLILFIL